MNHSFDLTLFFFLCICLTGMGRLQLDMERKWISWSQKYKDSTWSHVETRYSYVQQVRSQHGRTLSEVTERYHRNDNDSWLMKKILKPISLKKFQRVPADLISWKKTSSSARQLIWYCNKISFWFLPNSADEDIDSTFPANVVVSSDGHCLWVPPGLFLSTCKIDITWFPFDDQRCKMKFGSWTYDGSSIDLQLKPGEKGGDISNFIPNGEWELIGKLKLWDY